MKTILVQGGVVVNVIRSDSGHNNLISQNYQHVEEVNDWENIQIGATWDGSTYTNPPPPPDDQNLD